MSIFSRARDIIAANVTELIDRADDPAKTIRVIIMEMEETLVEVRASAARSIAEQKEKRRQIAVIEHLQASWTERAELALAKGREDLARGALVEKQKLSAMAAELQEEIDTVNASLREAEGDIAKLQAKLREARSRQAAIATRIESAQHRVRMREMVAGERTEAAFANFALLEQQPRRGAGARRAALHRRGNRRAARRRTGRCRARSHEVGATDRRRLTVTRSSRGGRGEFASQAVPGE
jgi:phage shock protein A